MYLLGYYGNNLYPSSLRLFSDKERLLDYLYEKWQETLTDFAYLLEEQDPWAQRFLSFSGYIKSISWRLYRIDINQDAEPVNIRSTTLAKWAEEHLNG